MNSKQGVSVQSINEAAPMDYTDDYDEDVKSACKNIRSSSQSSVGRWISVKCADAVLDWFIFPFLLFIQFGTSMYCQQQQQQQDRLTVQWEFAMCSICIFCIAAVGYRKIFRIHPIQSIILLLLPEIFTNIVLATVMFTNILNALYILITLTVVIFVVATIGFIQIQQYKRLLVTSPQANDYRCLHQHEREEEEHSDDEWVC